MQEQNLVNVITFTSLQTNTNIFANSADLSEMARNGPSHQDIHCLPFCSSFTTVTLLTPMDVSKCRAGNVFYKLRVERVNVMLSTNYMYTLTSLSALLRLACISCAEFLVLRISADCALTADCKALVLELRLLILACCWAS